MAVAGGANAQRAGAGPLRPRRGRHGARSECWTPVPSSWARRPAEPVLLRGSHSHTAGWSTGARLPQVRRGMRRTMQPRIDRTQFGSVTIDGKVFEHDVLIRLGGQVEKRKKRLSKAVYGTSHTISRPRPSTCPSRRGPRGCSSALASTVLAERGGQLLPAPPLPGGAAADAGGDPGLEPGRGRRHRHAPCDLLRGRRPSLPCWSYSRTWPGQEQGLDLIQRPAPGRSGRSRTAREGTRHCGKA